MRMFVRNEQTIRQFPEVDVQLRDSTSPNDGTPYLTRIQSCGGHCPGSTRATPVTCDGACSSFSAWLLSQHPDPTLRSIFRRTLARRSLGAFLVLSLVLAIGVPAQAKEQTRSSSSYELKLTEPPAAKAGELATATIRVLPKKPYKMNLEFPLRLKLGGPADGVSPKEVQLGVKQAKLSKEELLLKPAFKILKAGAHAIKGTLRFSVCTDAQCEIKQEELAFTTSAK